MDEIGTGSLGTKSDDITSVVRRVPNAWDIPAAPVRSLGEVDEQGEDSDPFPPEVRARQEADARRLLGLDRKYRSFAPETIGHYLPTPHRRKAYDSINTTTNPKHHKIEEKKNIVAEILSGDLLPLGVAKQFPTVYLGSGTDVEYPLALGSRHLIMVDYIFEDREAVEEVIERIRVIVGDEVDVTENVISFMFDFGDGLEPVTVILDSRPYKPNWEVPADAQFTLPDEIGLALGFASQGSQGRVPFDDDLKSHLAPSGMILNENVVITIDAETGKERVTQLGERE